MVVLGGFCFSRQGRVDWHSMRKLSYFTLDIRQQVLLPFLDCLSLDHRVIKPRQLDGFSIDLSKLRQRFIDCRLLILITLFLFVVHSLGVLFMLHNSYILVLIINYIDRQQCKSRAIPSTPTSVPYAEPSLSCRPSQTPSLARSATVSAVSRSSLVHLSRCRQGDED